ncbi:MAG: hypothetical protein AB1765_11565 [Candidatus Hydrogenedentota bacterium]
MSKQLLILIVLSIGLVLYPVTQTYAAENGTDSGTTIVNANDASDSIPDAAGEMSLSAANSSGSDTQYTDSTSTLCCTVILAFDLAPIDSNSLMTADTGNPGDTEVYKYHIRNLGNGSVFLTFSHTASGTPYGTAWGDTRYNVYHDADEDNAYDAGTDTRVYENYPLAPDNSETFFATVAIPSYASDGDSSVSVFKVTDNAIIKTSYGSTTGDGWEGGVPIWSNDSYDTQYDTVTTYVIYAVVRMAKRISSAGNYRPGDTIQYEIIYDNDGADTAKFVTIYEAIPTNTTYKVNSCWDSDPHSGNIEVAWENELTDPSFADAESASAAKIRWTCLSDVSPTDGDSTTNATDDGADLDAGRVRFKVEIN